TDVYVLNKPTALLRHSLAELREMLSWEDVTAHRPEDRHRGINLVRTKKDLFILGGPGAGKTTFVKHLALQTVSGGLNRIPIVIELRDWAATELELMAYITRQFEICAFPEADRFIEYILIEGEALVMFDGLDEVSEADDQRRETIRLIKDFHRQYHRSQCLVTCRIAATDYTFEGFTYLQMADFTPKQIETFVGQWFTKDTFRRDKFLADFNKDENKGVRELTKSPLLLTLLCLAFEETLHFSQCRVDIYKQALDLYSTPLYGVNYTTKVLKSCRSLG
ncbi:MAG: NACHT domain-containing protein, partial [Anaerolineae bacterium]|nr:NACHT domain-containing protein [Anaerolineae bacterium]